MNICVPTLEDKGMDSVAYGHFGSAPYFIMVDVAAGATKTIHNGNEHHAHGACNPLAALGGSLVSIVIVGGIGRRAVEALNSMGIKVFRSMEGTVRHNVEAWQKGELAELTVDNACGGHGHGGGCGH